MSIIESTTTDPKKIAEFWENMYKDEKFRHEHTRSKLKKYEAVGTPEELQRYKEAEKMGLSIMLPTHIGGKVFISREYEEFDGTTVKCVDESNLTGFINEDGRIFYLCYSKEHGSCDVEPKNLHLTEEAALAELGGK